ncbi:MAG: Ig-like domain-containing protein [Spirochaetaceae bacterium]|nr:Ig-like domain-containing protein [Spirochaetaceae bacterium]
MKTLSVVRAVMLRTVPAALLAAAPVIAALLCSGCDILRDGPFEVAAWSPGDGYHNPAGLEVALAFSQEPDKTSVERSFSLSENSRIVSGHFSWSGSRMIFNPASPLEADRDYLIVLKTGAQDTKGLSLERQFEAAFTTRPGTTRPRLLETVPPDGGIMAEERGPVELFFSSPMDRSSLQYLSFSPAISGVWALEGDGRRAVFTPSENWTVDREYRLSAGTELADAADLETGRPYVLHFSAGTDRTGPELLAAYAVDPEGNSTLVLEPFDGSASENRGWERTCRLKLVFSEPVDTVSVGAALDSTPALGMILESSPGYEDTLVYRFSDAPAYGSSFTLSLEKTVRDRSGNTMAARILWYIRADGGASSPPVLKGMRFPLFPGAAEGADLAVFTPENQFADLPVRGEYYPFDTGVSTWIELYFALSPGAVVDTFSLMNVFRMTATNGALSFSPREIRISGFTLSDPAAGWEGLCRVEIRGVLTNKPYTGMVTVEVGAGLSDSLGNAGGEAYRILLLK